MCFGGEGFGCPRGQQHLHPVLWVLVRQECEMLLNWSSWAKEWGLGAGMEMTDVQVMPVSFIGCPAVT